MFLWTTSRTVHKKDSSLLNPSPPKKSLLSPPVWLCLGSEMPALMNTNFPFRSIHQHIKLHFVSFRLFDCCQMFTFWQILWTNCLLFIWMKIPTCRFYLSIKAWQHHNECNNWRKKVTLNSVPTSRWLSMTFWVFRIVCIHLFKLLFFLLFRPICGKTTTRRWWHGWRDSSLKKRVQDPLSMRTSSTSAAITSSSRYAGGYSKHCGFKNQLFLTKSYGYWWFLYSSYF